MPEPPVRFALFVSAVRGHLVTRFGTDRPGLQSFIGAARLPGAPTEIVWDEQTIVPLSEAEVGRFRREYQRAIDGKALRQRTPEEYQAQVAARKKAEGEALAAAKKAADEKSKPPEKAKDPAPPEKPKDPQPQK